MLNNSPRPRRKKKFLPIFISYPPLSRMALNGETTSKSQPAKMGTSRRPGHKDRHGKVQLRGAAPHNNPLSKYGNPKHGRFG